MLIKIVAFVFLVSFQAVAYELPVSGNASLSNACGEYTNKKSDIFIKENNLKFYPYELRSGDKVIKDYDWNEMQFRTSMSAACQAGRAQADRVSEATAIKNGLSFYDTMYQSAGGGVSGDDIVKLIKDAVIFGRTVK